MEDSANQARHEQWRLTFIDTILALANYQADMLQVAAWADEAQHHRGRTRLDDLSADEYPTDDCVPGASQRVRAVPTSSSTIY